ncbi:MAG: DUF3467 domain-containing protein [Gammaproteobacteria bacterium]|nr:DUF3467 domain-containing protein [Gammaproteobacteria bacterium]NIR83221.1 DUF3467 domain-containing protein [Gammaproteobacteria bacterium]NIR91029.1 DUF3467 domain-containing protein [Gammaproteobacteria bacterium]NIU04386.1 DUF3467 domain-containing protein [Gammaproteobacteria bacterium]NIV52609.1 DUF3467 domain-containing protein [Gammaproteobacteria bacterium]
MANDQSKPAKQQRAKAEGRQAIPAVNWDDSRMKTSYANVVNASSTREEVTLFFGTNLTWNPAQAGELHVGLNDRIVLNPYAAKRLWTLLGAILKEYESRFGQLNIDVSGPRAGAGGGAGAGGAAGGNTGSQPSQRREGQGKTA